MDTALAVAQEGGGRLIFTDGPLIHNPQAVEELRRHGIVPIENLAGMVSGTIIIRSHGISPQRFREIENTGAHIVDATCPKVKKVQSIIDVYAERDFCIVILGDAGHAEVRGLLGFAGNRGIVVQTEEDLADIPTTAKVCVVAQTTQNRGKFVDLTRKIRRRFPAAKTFNTICDANRKRQEELRRLCHQVEAIVVVGGRESGNTKRLAEIAESTGIPTLFGEKEDDFDRDSLKKYKSVGLIGGASTPDWVLKGVFDKLVAIKT